MARMTLDTKTIRAYATVENLNKALEKHGILEHRHLVVKTEEGKWTAVFPQSNFEKYGLSYLGFYGQYGFFTLG